MKTLKELTEECTKNANNHGWFIFWGKIYNLINDSKENRKMSIGDTLCLCHSELSEALEAYRKDDKENFKEEIADEFIRLFHLCGDLNIDIETEIVKKMEVNKSRPKLHGKKNL